MPTNKKRRRQPNKRTTSNASATTGGKRGRPKGGGRSKSDQIRELLGSGMTGQEIAKKVGCAPGLVYVVKSHARGKPSRRQGRAKKSSSGVTAFVEQVKELERERDRLAAVLEKIATVLAAV